MLALIALLLLGGTRFPVPISHLTIDNLGINAQEKTEWYSYTNKEAGFYFGEVHGANDAPYQGWTVYDNPILRDYSLEVNGRLLDRGESKVVVYPDRVVREHKDGITETFTLLDDVNAFVVQLKAAKFSTFDFRVLFNVADPEDLSVSRGQATTLENKSVQEETVGRWVAVAGYKLGLKSSEQALRHFVSPAIFQAKGKEISIVVACGKTKAEAEQTALEAFRKRAGLLASRKERMQEILDRSHVTSGNTTFDEALAWAKLSLDALITDQGIKGIWAGLPWFDNYWGRDSFISLPAATLWQGDFETARQILLDFAAKQDTDSTSTNYGRIPNLIIPKETIYNTADGTPWFVNAVFLYYSMTGDRNFLFEIFPAVKRAFFGTVKYHLDESFFLVHADQETWMDAVGPNGPYTPRGNRAVDVEALWLRQILETRFLSGFVGEPRLRDMAEAVAKRLIANFNDKFRNEEGKCLYDHLNADGVPDSSFRPNQLFALWLLDNRQLRADILKEVVEKLTYPWGVASLYQGDPDFHPFHHDEPYYVPDAAYHNGTVWVWLTGPLVSALTEVMEQNFAFKSTMFLANQILDGKTAGTLPELFDAFPREPNKSSHPVMFGFPNFLFGKGEERPNESGAFSQAWSLAEFIKSFYEDYLGVQMDAAENSVTLNPHLPDSIRNVTFKLNGGNSNNYVITYRFDHDPKEIEILPTDSVPGTTFKIFFMLNKENQIRTAFYLQGREKVLLKFMPDTVIGEKGDAPFPINNLKTIIPHNSSLDSLHFQTPQINLGWNFRKQANFQILSSQDVKRASLDARLFSGVDDSSGDDRGPEGTYTYPLNQNFQPGILDIAHAEVSYDSNDVYFKLRFRNLVDPMWHPEYGFQLTFVAIAIGDGNGGQRDVGRNSNYTLPEGRGFRKVVYVGGGIEVFDEDGKKVAAYVPSTADTASTLGDVKTKEITFSLPVTLIGKANKDWKISILVGAQDDHGGGGVGEFRTVAGKATEWQGGGKENEALPNLYDELFLN